MQISMYQASVPCFIHTLKNLKLILDKAQTHARERKIQELALTGFRLYPDMLPFANQIMIATDTAKGCAARLAGLAAPVFEDTEQTLDELKARIDKTVAYLEQFQPQQLQGSETRTVVLKRRDGEHSYAGLAYLLEQALPNFYFHVTTAYAILRHNGVEIGKRDFLGQR